MSLFLSHAIYHPPGGGNLCLSPNAQSKCLCRSPTLFCLKSPITSNDPIFKIQPHAYDAASLPRPLRRIHKPRTSEHIQPPPKKKSQGLLSSHGDFKSFVLSGLIIKKCFRVGNESAVRNKPWLSISLHRYHYFSLFKYNYGSMVRRYFGSHFRA